MFDYAATSDTGYEVGNQKNSISDDLWNKIREYVTIPEENNTDSWILTWKYLPTGSDSTHDAIDSVPNFKVMNEAAILLADESRREEFVGRSIKKIEDTLLGLIK